VLDQRRDARQARRRVVTRRAATHRLRRAPEKRPLVTCIEAPLRTATRSVAFLAASAA
jgi:hypothetical protein